MGMSARRLFLLLALLASCRDRNSGDDSATSICTAIGCEDGLKVVFQPALHAEGTYDFEVALDGMSSTCTAVLPFDDLSVDVCDDPRVMLILSGTALPANQQEVYGMMIADTPSTVRITIDKDGDQVADQSFTPSYQQVAPNGVECGPICTQGTETLLTTE